ncbi:MAG: hypothetical protein SOZ61_09560, partial [Candidatus Copromonas sp.]|nr:hypothetical protein [Candidatus Copromonas sp.]
MKRTLAALLAASMALSLCACGGSKTAETTAAAAEAGSTEAAATETAGERAKTVTLGMNTQISTLDPFNGASTGTIYLTEALHDQLFSIPGLGEDLESEIGKTYEVSDDGKTLTVEIYDYVHDQAGNKITAEDVAWSYNTYLATGNATQFAKYLDSAEASDETHV